MMPPIKFWLNPTRFGRGGGGGGGGGGRCRFEEFQDGCRGGRPSWISEQNDFSNSESLCLCITVMPLIKGSAQSDLRFGRRCHLKNF